MNELVSVTSDDLGNVHSKFRGGGGEEVSCVNTGGELARLCVGGDSLALVGDTRQAREKDEASLALPIKESSRESPRTLEGKSSVVGDAGNADRKVQSRG